MKKILLLLFVLFTTSYSFGQIMSEDFEDATLEYTTDVTECTDNSFDYFIRTNGTDINGVYNSPGGSSFFAGMDLDADGCPLASGARGTLTFSNIDILAQTGLSLKIKLAEDDDGSNEDWDASGDHVHIKAQIDGGTIQNIIWVESELSTGSNGAPKIDTDFNGVGDGTEITDAFQAFTASIMGTGSLLTVTIEFDLDSGDEDLAIDDLQIFSNESPLPISFQSFTAKPMDNESVSLDWATASEENNEYFSIEHSTDGRDFVGVGMVEGALNSTTIQNYNFMHKEATKGVNYYRLRQVDTDGTFSFSSVEVVSLGADVAVEVRPTLADESVVVTINDTFNTEMTIEVYDILGRVVSTEVLARGATQTTMNVQDLQKGHYIVRVSNGQESFTKRFIKR